MNGNIANIIALVRQGVDDGVSRACFLAETGGFFGLASLRFGPDTAHRPTAVGR